MGYSVKQWTEMKAANSPGAFQNQICSRTNFCWERVLGGNAFLCVSTHWWWNGSPKTGVGLPCQGQVAGLTETGIAPGFSGESPCKTNGFLEIDFCSPRPLVQIFPVLSQPWEIKLFFPLYCKVDWGSEEILNSAPRRTVCLAHRPKFSMKWFFNFHIPKPASRHRSHGFPLSPFPYSGKVFLYGFSLDPFLRDCPGYLLIVFPIGRKWGLNMG